MPETQASKKLPQAARNLLEVSVRAILQADLSTPVVAWLKAQERLNESSRRQVSSLLLFLGVSIDSGQLVSEAEEWRSDHRLLSEELVRRFRDGYAAAGCDERLAELIGNPVLTEEALGRVLEGEPPFQSLKNKNPHTCGNAIRFARHVHGLIVEGGLVPQEIRKGTPSGGPPSRKGSGEESGQPGVDPPPRLNDLGTIVSLEPYRVSRVRDDLWVYGRVHFESPEGAGDPNWFHRLGVEEQARFLEQLAAALLQDADSLKPTEVC